MGLLFADAGRDAGFVVGGVLVAALLLVLTLWFVRHARHAASGRRRTIDMLAAALCGLLLVAALATIAEGRPEPSWDSSEGRDLRAGFIDGCEQGDGATQLVNCECVFDYIASMKRYDTPSEFAKLGDASAAADSPQEAPPAVIAALEACPTS